MSSTVTAAEKLTPEKVLAHIASVGAKKAVIDYYEKPGWPAITQGIASGNSDWLKVYVALVPVADAAAVEDLGDAIFDVLPAQPFKVLPILTAKGQYTVEQLCTFTFESKIPSGGINAYLNRLEKSLRKADSKEQRSMADSCRSGVGVTRENFKSSPDY